MDGKNGLEALAALASKVSVNSRQQSEENESASSVSASNGNNHGTSESLPSSMVLPVANPSLSNASANVMSQQIQQVLAAAARLNNNNFGNPNNLAMLSSLQQLSNNNSATDPSGLLALQQQIKYYQYLAGQQGNALQSNQASSMSSSSLGDAVQAISLALTGRIQPSITANVIHDPSRSQVLPSSSQVLPVSNSTNNNMPPPPPAIGSKPITVSTAGISSPQRELSAIAPQPSGAKFNDSSSDFDTGDRKTQKRAANRLSAQLSRKRKKQFIEELKEENDGLRRKELILKSIPDLVVVFDSSGKLWFVSESVHRFLDFTANELEGTSFWDRLCGDSVRLLKAAFMDSLAARQSDSDTAPLGTGLWELRLVDKDGSQKVVSLNGVVHFAGERPECVCSIRPQEEYALESESSSRKKDVMRESSTGSSLSSGEKSVIRVRFHPQQSVVSNDHSDASSSSRAKRRAKADAVRISDSGNSSSGGSDSGSSDEMNAEVGAN